MTSTKKLLTFALVPFLLTGCKGEKQSYKVDPPKDDGIMIKETNFTKVFIIAGQSNAVGCSHNEYLKEHLSEKEYLRFQNGIDNVDISYSNTTTIPESSSFVPVKLGQGAANCFGPEIGFADIMSQRSKEKVYIIKHAIGGSILHSEWLDKNGNRGNLYNNLVTFTKREFAKLKNAKICGFVWMQGESDAVTDGYKYYLRDQSNLISFFRDDIKDLTVSSGFTFVDAGVADNWNHYDEVNKAKIDYLATSKLNGYFSTTENGLSNEKEPYDKPDRAHYDAMSELQLGRWFALKTIELFNQNYKE